MTELSYTGEPKFDTTCGWNNHRISNELKSTRYCFIRYELGIVNKQYLSGFYSACGRLQLVGGNNVLQVHVQGIPATLTLLGVSYNTTSTSHNPSFPRSYRYKRYRGILFQA